MSTEPRPATEPKAAEPKPKKKPLAAPKAVKPPTPSTSLAELAREQDEDPMFVSGFVAAMGLKTVRGKRNSKALTDPNADKFRERLEKYRDREPKS